jgi:Protein of unknown function (DUF1501)
MGDFGPLPSLGFSMWLAVVVVQGGFLHGATDELGMQAVENRMHVHGPHATILRLLGLDSQRVTTRTRGRDFRRTHVSRRGARQLLACDLDSGETLTQSL